jgi:23S rRNA pseudouridine1911/1915/1917 synthase
MQQTDWMAESPMRLDAFLAQHPAMKSRMQAQKLIEDGNVSIEGKTIKKPAYTLEIGDVVSVTFPESLSSDDRIEAVNLHLPVLFEDASCMVVDKPAGISVHPAPGMKDTTILHGAAFLFKERKLPFSPSEVLVHRLDKETTGCLLLAKTPKAHLALQKQFQDRTVEKTYLALVYGVPVHPKAVIEASIGRDPSHRTRMSVHRTKSSRDARTGYTVLSSTRECSLLACDLFTGRTHQIRVHLKSIGHPVLGDSTYYSPASEKCSAKNGIDDLCLHAWKLSFVSPASKKKIALEATPAPLFQATLEKLGLQKT